MSDTALAFLEALLTVPYLTFTNLYLLAPLAAERLRTPRGVLPAEEAATGGAAVASSDGEGSGAAALPLTLTLTLALALALALNPTLTLALAPALASNPDPNQAGQRPSSRTPAATRHASYAS